MLNYSKRVYRMSAVTMVFVLFTTWSLCAYAGENNVDNNSFIRGAKLWENTCSRCHNMRSPDEFRPDQWRAIMAHMRIRAGLTGKNTQDILIFLTGQSKKHEPSQANKVVTSLTNKNKINSTKATVRKKSGKISGSVVYKRNCAACHGKNGRGVIPDASDMTKANSPLVTKSYNILLKNIEHGVGNMPAKGGNSTLSRDELKAALSYMTSKFKKIDN